MPTFKPPTPPASFLGQRPPDPSNPVLLADVIHSIRYSTLLGLSTLQGNLEKQAQAMIYQTCVINEFIKNNHPEDAPVDQDDRLFRQISALFNSKFNDLTTSLDKTKADLNTRLDGLDKQLGDTKADLGKRLDGLDKRLDGLDKRLDNTKTEFEKRFDGVDKRFDGVDKRFDGVDKRFDDTKADFDKRFDVLNGQLKEVHQRLDRMDKQLKGHSDNTKAQFDTLNTKVTQLGNDNAETTRSLDEMKDSLASLLTRVNDLEETERDLKVSIQDMPTRENLRTAVRDGLNAETADLGRDIRALKTTLDKVARIQLLHINSTRPASGPWSVIGNPAGALPTDQPHNLPSIESQDTLSSLSNEDLYNYLQFYGIEVPAGRTRRGISWDSTARETASQRLREFLTRPV